MQFSYWLTHKSPKPKSTVKMISRRKRATREASEVQTGWRQVLSDAESALREHLAYGRVLRRSIRIIRAKIMRGDDCPGFRRTRDHQRKTSALPAEGQNKEGVS